MVVAALTTSIAVALVMTPVMQLLARPLQQGVDRTLPLAIPPEGLLVTLLQRGHIDQDTYTSLMRRLGYNDDQAERWRLAGLFYPSPSDLVSWQSREVFEPDSIARYGLDNEFEGLELEPFRRAGMDDEQIRNFWRAHWQHPPFGQVADMLHRDLLMGVDGRDAAPPGSPAWQELRDRQTEEVYDWYRLVEIAPHWRDKLTQMAYLPYTRVDIRRMWDLGVATDEDVLRAYLDQGYDLEHAQGLLAFTKVERRLPDLVQMYKNGWIDAGQIREFLLDAGIAEHSVEQYVRQKLPNLDAPHRVARERDLTKSEIIKGVKKGLITEAEAEEFLVEIGYDADEAHFIVRINVESEGSPETPLEFRQLTQAYRKAAKLPSADITPEMLAAEQAYLELSRQLADQMERRATGHDVDQLARRKAQALSVLQSLYIRAGLPPPTG